MSLLSFVALFWHRLHYSGVQLYRCPTTTCIHKLCMCRPGQIFEGRSAA